MRLDVQNLSYSFGDKKVLKDVSFDVRPGEFVGLMGPNGSGKTTLLRCIIDYLSPPADSISIDGASIHALS